MINMFMDLLTDLHGMKSQPCIYIFKKKHSLYVSVTSVFKDCIGNTYTTTHTLVFKLQKV